MLPCFNLAQIAQNLNHANVTCNTNASKSRFPDWPMRELSTKSSMPCEDFSHMKGVDFSLSAPLILPNQSADKASIDYLLA